MHHCEALNLLLLSYVIVHNQMHREVFDFFIQNVKISLNVWMSILSCCLKPTEVGGCQGLFYDVAACLRMRNCNVLNLVCWFQSSDYCIVYINSWKT